MIFITFSRVDPRVLVTVGIRPYGRCRFERRTRHRTQKSVEQSPGKRFSTRRVLFFRRNFTRPKTLHGTRIVFVNIFRAVVYSYVPFVRKLNERKKDSKSNYAGATKNHSPRLDRLDIIHTEEYMGGGSGDE